LGLLSINDAYVTELNWRPDVYEDMEWIWFVPLVAAVLHILEEFVYPGGFAEWDRNYRPGIRKSITRRFHIVINAALVIACINIALAGYGESLRLGATGVRSGVSPRFAPIGWLVLAALLFSNAVFHIVGTVRSGRRSPGVISGVGIYLPMAAYGYFHFVSTGLVAPWLAVVAALVGSSYHFWAALIHKRRSRLCSCDEESISP